MTDIIKPISLNINDTLWFIDEPHQSYEIIKEQPKGYFYVVLFHPSFKDIKHISVENIGKTFFKEKEEMIQARINRAKRNLEIELNHLDKFNKNNKKEMI